MLRVVSEDSAPAIGDLRACGVGDTIVVRKGATERRDWSRCWDAIGVAFVRGALVVRG